MSTEVIGYSVHLGGLELDLLMFLVCSISIAVFVVAPLLLKNWYFYNRRIKSSVISAAYMPPLNLSPSEINYFFDGKPRDRVVGATIIDLIQRGYLTVKKVNGRKRIFPGKKIDDKIKKYEEILMVQVGYENGISGLELLRGSVRSSKGNLIAGGKSKDTLTVDLTKRVLIKSGFLRKNYQTIFTRRVLKVTWILSVALVWTPLLIVVVYDIFNTGSSELISTTELVKVFLAVSATSMIVLYPIAISISLFVGRINGKHWRIAKNFEIYWAQVVAFRQYVKLAEKDKLEYRSKQMQKRSNKDTLPYAVALGFVKNWRDIIS